MGAYTTLAVADELVGPVAALGIDFQSDASSTGDDLVFDFTDAVSGDILIVVVCTNTDDDSSATIGAPAGWTGPNEQGPIGGASNETIQYIYYKVASGSETTETFTCDESIDFFGMGFWIDSTPYDSIGSIQIGTVATGTTNFTHTQDPDTDRSDTTSDGWILLWVGTSVSNQPNGYAHFPYADEQFALDYGETMYEWTQDWAYQYWDIDSGSFFTGGVGHYSLNRKSNLQLTETLSENPRLNDNPISVTWDHTSGLTTVSATPIWINVNYTAKSVGRFATRTASIPQDDNLVSRFAIYAASIPYTEGASVITMLMPNPDNIETTSRLNEVRFPDIPSAVRGVKVEGVTGHLSRRWEIMVDLSNVMNVSNEPVSPDVAFDQLSALRNKELLLPFVDRTGSVWRDESEDITVKIEEVTRVKGESPFARITVAEVNGAEY